MVKRFSKGKAYTLCLANNDGNTFTRNVTMIERKKNIVKFNETEYKYQVNLDTKEVDCVERFGEKTFKYSCANIVQGWQW